MLTIYRYLQNNVISVIKNNTFNNLPRLVMREYHLMRFVQMYNSILLIFVIVNYMDMIVNIDIVESKTYQ
jgi:hypothetical protein